MADLLLIVAWILGKMPGSLGKLLAVYQAVALREVVLGIETVLGSIFAEFVGSQYQTS